MRKLFTLLLTAFTITSFAQEIPYTLEVFGEEYSDLEGATSLNDGQVWDDPSYVIPIGFDFFMMNYPIEEFALTGGGAILVPNIETFNTHLLIAYGSDIMDAGYGQDSSLSSISHVTEGEFPNRICKIEWKNCSFWNEYDAYGTSTNTVNFQVWLYEGTYDIEIRFGPSSIKAGDLVHDFNGEAWSGIIKNMDLINEQWQAFWYPSTQNESWVLETAASFDEIGTMPFYGGDPANGAVFRFATGLVSVEEELSEEIKVYPSLFGENTTIFSDANHNYRVYSLTGQQVEQGRTLQGRTPVSMAAHPAGIYILQVDDGQQTQSYRLIKQ